MTQLSRVFGYALLAAALAFVGGTLSLGPVARRTPLAVGVLLTALVAFHLVREHARSRSAPPDAPSDDRVDVTLAALWVLSLPAAIYAFGLYGGVVGFTLLFALVRGREAPVVACTLAGALGLLVWILVERVLSLSAPPPTLLQWLGLL